MTEDLPSVSSGADARRRAAQRGRMVGSPLVPQIAGIVVGLAVVELAHLVGAGRDAYATLTVMGFDPDRARLIEALTFAALASGAGALATARRAGPIVVAFLAVAIVFGRAFFEETILSLGGSVPHAAYDPSGWLDLALAAARTFLQASWDGVWGHAAPTGFDPVGWVATVLALVVATLASGWAAAVLSLEIRRWLRAGVALTMDARLRHPIDRRQAARAILPIVALALVLVSLPTLADMINYTPDVAMTHQGIAESVPLTGGAGPGGPPSTGPAGAVPAGGATGGSAGTGSGGASGPAAGGGESPPAGIVTPASALSSARPWAARPPKGTGSIQATALPAPWVGGNYTQSHVWVYVPAGYAASARRYPTLYLVPWDLAHWQLGAHMTTLLDTLIARGSIPPMIAVFIDLNGGPFPNSECANSYDGRQHADTFVADTVVSWVDQHYRTIPDARARTIAGFSQGAFCAANLQMRHPGTFANAISFSGYFVAGFRSGDTVNAWRPWGSDPATIAANSPVQVSATIPAAIRQTLFVVLSAQPDETIYGAQAVGYAADLKKLGYPTDVLWNALGHAWVAVRAELSPALEAVAARMAETGVLR